MRKIEDQRRHHIDKLDDDDHLVPEHLKEKEAEEDRIEDEKIHKKAEKECAALNKKLKYHHCLVQQRGHGSTWRMVILDKGHEPHTRKATVGLD